jgi:predicted DNA binding CopG/RHH family protein
MAKRLKRIPDFHDEEAEREFWATHDLADYFDVARARPVVFPELRPSTESISLRLPASLLAGLKVLAHRVDVPYQSLMKVYLAERVEQELRRGRTAAELAATVREPEAPYGVAPPGTHRRQKPRRPSGRGATPKTRRR